MISHCLLNLLASDIVSRSLPPFGGPFFTWLLAHHTPLVLFLLPLAILLDLLSAMFLVFILILNGGGPQKLSWDYVFLSKSLA